MENLSRVLKDFISSKKPENELEIRFSTYVKNDTFQDKVIAQGNKTANYKFIPVIDRRDYYRVLNTFENFGLSTFDLESTDYFFYMNKLRKTVYSDGTITWEEKNKFKYHDIFPFNLRIALAEEIKIDFVSDTQVETVRHKKRRSFCDDTRSVRYDFTTVSTEKGGVTKESFEIEIEIINKDVILENVLFAVKTMLTYLQESSELIQIHEKFNCLLEYKSLTRSNSVFFVGAQPECLHNTNVLDYNKYSVTEKYDGERLLAFISDNSKIYFYDRKMKPKLFGFKNNEHRGSLLDTELVGDCLYFYDIIFHKGVDLRGNKQFDLQARLALIKNILTKTYGGAMQLKLKPFFFGENDWKKTIRSPSQCSDGFIFTPIKEPYSIKQKWTSLFKWKPLELSSVDFLVKVSPENRNIWFLYVGGETSEIPCSFLPQVNVSNEIADIWNQFDNFIIEASLLPVFTPLKVRYDKTKPNFRTIAQDTWNYVNKPISIEDLVPGNSQLTKKVVVHTGAGTWDNMRKLHNTVKSSIIEKTVSLIKASASTQWADIEEEDIKILDLACGRGGDLLKWRANCKLQNAFYLGLDVNSTLLDEAKRRAKKINNSEFTTNFLQVDLTRDSFVAHTKHHFDVVSCQFALHYFFGSKDKFSTFMTSVTMNLKPNGYFICSLFDGLSTFKYLKNSALAGGTKSEEFSIECVNWTSRTPLSNLLDRVFGNEIKVSINNDPGVILNELITENLVFSDQLTLEMSKEGLFLIETKKFVDSELGLLGQHKMDKHEKIYSGLHRYYIFQYLPCEKILDYWSTFEYGLISEVKFKRIIKESEISFFLDLITGKETGLDNQNKSGLISKELSEQYGIFIGEIDNDNLLIYEPELFLTESSIVYFLRNEGIIYLLGNSDKKFLFEYVKPEEVIPDQQLPEQIIDADDLRVLLRSRPLVGKNRWTIKELLEIAEKYNVKIPSKKKKEEIYGILLEN